MQSGWSRPLPFITQEQEDLYRKIDNNINFCLTALLSKTNYKKDSK